MIPTIIIIITILETEHSWKVLYIYALVIKTNDSMNIFNNNFPNLRNQDQLVGQEWQITEVINNAMTHMICAIVS